MRLIVCAVFDVAAECYGRPIFTAAVGLAIRSFTDEVNRNAPENALHQHPADFMLFQLGTFDDNSGTFEPMQPKRLCTGADVILTNGSR